MFSLSPSPRRLFKILFFKSLLADQISIPQIYCISIQFTQIYIQVSTQKLIYTVCTVALLKDTSHCIIIFAFFPAINFHFLESDITPLRTHAESNILQLMGETINTEFYTQQKYLPKNKGIRNTFSDTKAPKDLITSKMVL